MSEPKISRELLQQAERVFGDHKTVAAWFWRPNLNLGGRRPIDALEAGDETIVALMLDQMEPPTQGPYA